MKNNNIIINGFIGLSIIGIAWNSAFTLMSSKIECPDYDDYPIEEEQDEEQYHY